MRRPPIHSRPRVPHVLQALADLVLPRCCAGCGAPSTWWCDACADVARTGLVALPVGAVSVGAVPCASAAPYDGPAGRALVALKERSAVALRRPLTDLLTHAVDRAIGDAARQFGGVPGGVVLVPVPSRPSTVRARGHDVVADLARGAAVRLRAAGLDVRCVPVLRHGRRVHDQAGLDRSERRANLDGALVVRPAAARRLRPGPLLVVVDDVVTTGATLTEAVRALREAFPEHEIRAASILRA